MHKSMYTWTLLSRSVPWEVGLLSQFKLYLPAVFLAHWQAPKARWITFMPSIVLTFQTWSLLDVCRVHIISKNVDVVHCTRNAQFLCHASGATRFWMHKMYSLLDHHYGAVGKQSCAQESISHLSIVASHCCHQKARARLRKPWISSLSDKVTRTSL
jgi:hypothetical protein